MTDGLSPVEHTGIGAIAGSMEVLLMQPTIAIKNALQEGRAISWSPNALYRGLVVGHTVLRPFCTRMNHVLQESAIFVLSAAGECRQHSTDYCNPGALGQ